jgi:hypothetical protein
MGLGHDEGGQGASIVKKIGWATAADPKVHMNPASLWQSLIFSPTAAMNHRDVEQG